MKKQTLLLTMIVMFCLGARTVFSQDGCWTTKTNMSVAKNVMPTSVVNGIIYAIGGSLDAYTSTSDVEAYDAATDSWTSKADLPQELCATTAGRVNDKIYIIGGTTSIYGNGYVVDSVYEYDPVLNSWTTKSNIPTPLAAAAADVVNGKIYVIGGAPFGWNSAYNTVFEYDPATDTWTQKGDMPTARWELSATAVDGKIYVFGGAQNMSLVGLSTVEVYDPSADTWATKAAMPTPRVYHASSAANGKIYVFGGSTGTSTLYKDVQEYDPALDTWTTKTAMPTARWGLGACTVAGKIYAIGGADIMSQRLSTVEEYDPALDLTSVGEGKNPSFPVEYSLYQNYPNPFNPETRIKYELPHAGKVVLKVYDIIGKEIYTLVDEGKPAGSFEVLWDAKDKAGQRVASGMYLYRIEGQSFVQTRKMLLLE